MLIEKIWFVDAMFVLIVVAMSIGGVCLPRIIVGRRKTRDWGSMLFHLGNAMSGGVMLGGALCHLLPDAAEAIGPTKYPITFAVAGVGYMLTILMELVVIRLSDVGGHSHCQHHHHIYNHVEQTNQIVSELLDQSDGANDAAQLGQRCMFPGDSVVDGLFVPILELSTEHAPAKKLMSTREDSVLIKASESVGSCHGKFMSALILGIALSYHSALTGTAIGAQSNLTDAVNLMGVVLAHKVMESFALGSSIMNSKTTPLKFWTLTLLYSASLPLGILTSYFFAAKGNTPLTGIMCGLSAGTFLHVGIGEIIATEMADPSHRFKKLFCILFGFTIMAVLPLLEA